MAKKEEKEPVVSKSEYPKLVKFNQPFEGELDTGKVRWSVRVGSRELKKAKAAGSSIEKEIPNEVVFNWLKKFGVINA